MTDYDSPWKEALDLFFRAFLALLFPHIHRDIDWPRGFEMLDKELQQLLPKAAQGRRTVDKLVKVWRRNGAEAWVLIHVEVQTRRERGFGRRMFVYNSRIADRYNREVISLAVLADDNANWRPNHYEWELWGCRNRMEFPLVKLLDFAGRESELEADPNPFAVIVLAHLKALETRRDVEDRRAWKFRLVRGLYERGFNAERVRQLLRLIDWLMELPPPAQQNFERDVDAYREGKTMPFVTSWERRGMLKLIEDLLRTKFGVEGAELMPAIVLLNDAEKYETVNRAIVTATTVNEVRQACAEAAVPSSCYERNAGAAGERAPTAEPVLGRSKGAELLQAASDGDAKRSYAEVCSQTGVWEREGKRGRRHSFLKTTRSAIILPLILLSRNTVLEMIPDFNDDGYLPPGIHRATLEEIVARFGQEPELRQAQTESLRWLLDLAKRAGVLRLVIDGSYVTNKWEPNDIDWGRLLPLTIFRRTAGCRGGLA